MKILIIEDEPPIARDIIRITQSLIGTKVEKIDTRYSLEQAFEFLEKHSIDLCLLDLNLRGNNGYDILKRSVSGSFHTIIISAHTDQAIEAFNYGVLDFVPKPIERDRLQIAFNKYLGIVESKNSNVKYLVVRRQNCNHLVSINDIRYFEAKGYLVYIYLKDGKSKIIEKPLNRLMQILPQNFMRVHRSFIVDLNEILFYKHKSGGVYELGLKNGETIPLSRSSYKLFQKNRLVIPTVSIN